MADAKYLLAVMSMVRSELVPHPVGVKLALSVARRLNSSGIQENGGMGWGLGFPWGSADSSMTYTITTSLVAHSTIVAAQTLGPLCPSECLTLLDQAHRWLSKVDRVTTDGPHTRSVHLPIFSSHKRIAITNVVSYWLGALVLAGRQIGGTQELSQAEVVATSDWIFESYIPSIGWPYSPDQRRIDLLHQCYVINGLSLVEPSARLEQVAIQTLALFWDGGRVRDKIDIAPQDEALETRSRAGSTSLQIRENHSLILHSEPARNWSIGELATVIANMARQGRYRRHWTISSRRFIPFSCSALEVELSKNASGPRHAMHLAHGAAEILSVLRSPKEEN